ncbi:MAG: TonB-dependent receptor [Arenicella sp.]|nr:TonB-dependent receptor [Arenicella sp.]
MNYFPACRLSVVVLASLFTSITEASDQLEQVSVIGTRSPQPVSLQAANVSLINKEELERVSAVHIQQTLNRVPGVSLQRGNGQESLPGIRSAVLTGAGACGSVLILEDAIPVRGAGVCNVNELFDTHFEQAERIEVVRGANTAFYGSNALTGSVNVVLPSEGQNQASLELGANDYVRGKAAFSYDGGRVYASITDDGGYRDDSGYTQQKFSWRHAEQVGRWQLNAGATYTNLDQQTAGFIVGRDAYKNRSLARQNLDPEAFRKTNSLRAWLKASTELANGADASGTIYIRDTDMDFRLHFLPGDPLEQNAQTGFGWQSAITFKPNQSLNWTIGFDGDITDSELQQTQDQATQGSAFLRATIPTGVHYDYQVDAQQIALFTHADWSIAEQWRLVAGARLERTEYDYDNLGLDGRTRDDGSECGFGGCRYSRPADREDSFTHLSPKLELHYQANDAWRFTLALADSFRAPQATELYRLQRAQNVADLDIVESVSVELTAQYQADSLQFSASLYRLDIDNLIIRDSSFFNVDGQSTLSQGVEFSLRQALSEMWSWRVVGSFAEHEYTSDLIVGDRNFNGNTVDTAPEFFGSLFLTWQASDRASVEMEVQRVSSYFLDPSNDSEYEGHTLVNTRANVALDEHWAFGLRLLNITDQRYAERADFTSFTDERYFPGQPRSIFAEARYRF